MGKVELAINEITRIIKILKENSWDLQDGRIEVVELNKVVFLLECLKTNLERK